MLYAIYFRARRPRELIEHRYFRENIQAGSKEEAIHILYKEFEHICVLKWWEEASRA